MKALVYAGARRVELRELQRPRAAGDDVLFQVEAVGICGSDLHAYRGEDPRRVPPVVLGHEFAGIVASGPAAGMRATASPLVPGGRCEYCGQGRTNLCANRQSIGLTRPGAFADYVLVPAQNLIELPPGLDATHAALTEPAATALHALHLAMRAAQRPLPECSMLVIGGGAIGMLAALLARAYGVQRLTVAEINPLRRASVERHVGCAVYDPLAGGGPGDGSVDVVVDAVGAKGSRNAAFAAVKPGGVIMHIGLQDRASEIDMRKLTLAEITLSGSYTYTTADLRATVAALHAGVFGDLAWVETRRLGDGAAAFEDLDQGRSAAAKIVLRP